MSKRMIMDQLLEENHGYLMASQVMEKGISRTALSQYVKSEGLERVTCYQWLHTYFKIRSRDRKIQGSI